MSQYKCSDVLGKCPQCRRQNVWLWWEIDTIYNRCGQCTMVRHNLTQPERPEMPEDAPEEPEPEDYTVSGHRNPDAKLCQYGHALTEANTYTSRVGTKFCRQCRKRNQQRFKAKHARFQAS